MKDLAHSQPSAVERAAGNTGTSMAATLIAAFSGNPIAALLPVLTGALASSRHKHRVEQAINDIGSVLEEHAQELKHISDEQYKIINETVLSIFQTVDEKKLAYLRLVVNNVLRTEDIKSQESVLLSRLIRDMSAEELKFLIDNYSYRRIQLGKQDSSERTDVLRVDPDSREALVVTGLISLGLLVPGEATWDDTGLHRYSRIVPKLMLLLSKEKS